MADARAAGRAVHTLAGARRRAAEAGAAQSRAQSSLEALLAFAALLCALAVLAHAARAQADAFSLSAARADARVSLAREALFLDLSADLMPGTALSKNLSGVPAAGGAWLASNSSGAVREPLFHRISASGGRYYAQK